MYVKSKTCINDPDYKKHKRQEDANAYLRLLKKSKRPFIDYVGIEPQMDASITSNVVDESTVTNVVNDNASIPFNIPAGMTSAYQQGIKDFFMRPILLDQIIVNNSFSMSPLYELSDLFESNTMWKNKLLGYYGIRGTFVIRAQFNAQPFQQGVYMLQYMPMYKEQKFTNGKSSTWNRESYLMTRTQLPRAEIDISEQTEVTLKIPHRSLSSHYNMITKTGTWGVVFLSTYIQLDNPPTSSIDSFNVTLWASLEDIEFAAPTAPMDDLEPQMDISLEENKPGPVEKIAAQVENVSTLANAIPILSPVASPLAWAANITKRVASIFGWSKPVNSEKITRVYQTSNMYQQNCDGVDNAFNLGLMAENKVKILPSLGGNNLDEMSIAFIKSKFAYFTQVSWPHSSQANTTLFTTPVCPYQFTNSVSVPTLTLFTPIAGLAQCFAYWRGSIKFRIKIGKTKFHSGRLVVSFVPGYARNQVPIASDSYKTDLSSTQYLHRTILDIREASEFEFIVPYVNMFPYAKSDQPIGSMQIHVLNPLVAPDIVCDTVRMNIEVAGGEDLEFACPKAPDYFPTQGSLDGLMPNPKISYTKSVIKNINKYSDIDRYTVGSVSSSASDHFILHGSSTFADDRATIRLSKDVFDEDGEAISLNVTSSNKFYRYRVIDVSYAETLINKHNYVKFKETAADTQFYIIASVRAEDCNDYYLSIMKIDDNIVPQMDIGAASTPSNMITESAEQCIGEQILSIKQLVTRAILKGHPAAQDYVNTGVRFPSRPHLVYSHADSHNQLYFNDYFSYFGSCFAYSRGGAVIRLFKTDTNSSSKSVLLALGFDTSHHVMSPIGDDSSFKSLVFERIITPTILSAYVPMYNDTFGRLNARVVGDDIGVAHPFGQSVYVTTNDLSQWETGTFISRCGADDTQFSFFLGFPPMVKR